MKKILIIAGEASSDMHAANLVREIKLLDRDVSFFGLGGDKMHEAGVNILNNIVRIAFIGPSGLFKHYGTLKKIYRSLCSYVSCHRPDCAILIDYAEFNLRVAEYLKKLGVPIIYYISPQVWAWGSWRIKTIKRLIDKMLVLFKFEKELYEKHGVDAVFVGHPLLDIVKVTDARENIIKNLNLKEGARAIGILPGSRKSEIKNILPVMLKASEMLARKLNNNLNGIEFILPLAPTISEELIKGLIGVNSLNIRIIKSDTHNAISICDAAMVASGTATLETAILGVPMGIIYKANMLTYLMTRILIRLPYIGLVNVVSGERVVPEFLQYGADPNKISDHIAELLNDKKLADSMRRRFLKIKASLGEPHASRRAAEEVVNFLDRP